MIQYRKPSHRQTYDAARDLARNPAGLNWLYSAMRDPSQHMTSYTIKIVCAAIRSIHPKSKF